MLNTHTCREAGMGFVVSELGELGIGLNDVCTDKSLTAESEFSLSSITPSLEAM